MPAAAAAALYCDGTLQWQFEGRGERGRRLLSLFPALRLCLCPTSSPDTTLCYKLYFGALERRRRRHFSLERTHWTTRKEESANQSKRGRKLAPRWKTRVSLLLCPGFTENYSCCNQTERQSLASNSCALVHFAQSAAAHFLGVTFSVMCC